MARLDRKRKILRTVKAGSLILDVQAAEGRIAIKATDGSHASSLPPWTQRCSPTRTCFSPPSRSEPSFTCEGGGRGPGVDDMNIVERLWGPHRQIIG